MISKIKNLINLNMRNNIKIFKINYINILLF